MKWLIAFGSLLIGVMLAIFSLGFLGFLNWGCYGSTHDTANLILYITAGVSIIAGLVPAILILWKKPGKVVIITAALGLLVTIGLNAMFVFYTMNIC